MKKFLALMTSALLLMACGSKTNDDPTDLTSKFKGTWNIHEKLQHNDDGSITYTGVAWGGMSAMVKEHNLPVDWSDYESIVFEMAEPTKVMTQVVLSEKLNMMTKAGVTTVKCNFYGNDVSAISEVALQLAEPSTITVKRVYLTKAEKLNYSTSIWTGECLFGNWSENIVIPPTSFNDAVEGDKLEFIYPADRSNPDVTYWQFRTVYNGTDTPLEGNSDELNDWGCAAVGKGSTDYQIKLTANDVMNLKEKGLVVSGYFLKVTECNLLQ